MVEMRAEIDWCVKAVLRQRLEHRQEPAGHDRAERSGTQQVDYFRETVECRCVETNYPSNTAKRTPCSMLQLVANQWDVRVTTSEHVHNGNGGAEQAASEVVSKNRPATGSGSPSSQEKKFRRVRRTPRFWLTELQEFQTHDPKKNSGKNERRRLPSAALVQLGNGTMGRGTKRKQR